MEARLARPEEIRESHSTWARRLLRGARVAAGSNGRAVVLVRLRS
jgi:hypothetical protein